MLTNKTVSPVIPVLFFCHPSSPFFVIPVPRHWDPGILLSW
ncbi:hypothetical protein [Wolbachia endosymbiont (group A) of Sphaerophoria taeniata]|nr:hypothetical protein [Wolbachia endosymbiont (group A) of Sphaerophoria taeniata]